MNQNLAILSVNRRNNGNFNIARHDNPHPSRRSKAAPISVQNSSRTATLYALLLAGQYVAQAAEVLKNPPGRLSDAIKPKSNPGAKSNDDATGEFASRARESAGPGAQRSNSSEAHASGMQPKSPATLVELQENSHRNASASSNVTGAVPVLTDAVSEDSHLVSDSRSRDSTPNVLQAQPHKRSVDEKNATREAVASDVQTEEHPLIVARQKAIRNLLGEAANGVSDADLLAFANKIHSNEGNNGNSDLVSDADLALWKEEAITWCAENGGDKRAVNEERCLEIFKEAWDLALNPPPPPSGFKTWHQIKEDLEKNMSVFERMKYKFTPGGGAGEVAQINARATKLYYAQFVDYIEKHLDRFATAKAISNAGMAGLSPLEMEYPIRSARIVRGVSLNTLKPKGDNPSIRVYPTNIPLTNKNPAAFIFPFGGSQEDAHFGVIGPKGEFKIITRKYPGWETESWGRLLEVKFSNREILSAMGIPFATHDNPFSPECQASNLGACSIANFIVDKGTEIGFFMALNGKAVKEVMEGQIREEVKHSIKSFKEGNDGKDAIDKIFSLMIPFYDQIIGGINDPGHQVEIGDIALDLIDVGLTLTAIGKIGVSTLRGGLANARATLAAGKGTLAAFRSFKESIKISSLARKVGGELLDFVSPPFTSFNLNRIKGGDLPLTELKKIKNPDGADVLRCKRGAFGNCGFNWRPSRVGPAPGRARYLDEIYKKVDVKFKDPYVTEAGLKKFIDSRADLELPDVVYRAQPRPGGGGVGGVSYKEVGFTGPAHATQDDVLVSAIIHTASETGVKAKAASLSGKQEVSMHFMTENRDRGYALFKINKPNGENPFRRIEGIIKYDGPRLVEEGKLTEEQLIDACYQVFITKEDEIFYVANFGKIPQNLVSEVQV